MRPSSVLPPLLRLLPSPRRPLLLPSLSLAACDLAPPPERMSDEAKEAREHTELRDTIQQPIDKAKGAEQIQQQGDEERRKKREAEGGGAGPLAICLEWQIAGRRTPAPGALHRMC